MKNILGIKLFLSESLEPERDSLFQYFINSQAHLEKFALKYGWGNLLKPGFIQRAEIYDEQAEFIKALLRVCEVENSSDLPSTVSAALEKEIFMSVSPLRYYEIFPEGRETRAFEKLITHEMAHRLHIRILNGDEEAMGPIWFFEGFAIFAADQFSNAAINQEKIWKLLEKKDRGSYLDYGATIRFFLNYVTLPRMVERASQKEFHSWLKKSVGI